MKKIYAKNLEEGALKQFDQNFSVFFETWYGSYPY